MIRLLILGVVLTFFVYGQPLAENLRLSGWRWSAPQKEGWRNEKPAVYGWRWFNEPKEPTRKKQKRELASVKPRPVETSKMNVVLPPDPTPETFLKLPVSYVRKQLESSLEQAMSDLSEESVLRYLFWMDVARRKALAFANMTSWLIAQHPELDMNSAMPSALHGYYASRKRNYEAVKNLLKRVQNEYGLILVIRGDDPVSLAQLQTVEYFVDRYGWDYAVVDALEKPRAAAALGTQVLPTTFLLSREGKKIPLCAGAVSVSELELLCFRAVGVLEGKIPPQSFGIYPSERGGPFDPYAIPIRLIKLFVDEVQNAHSAGHPARP